MPDAQRPPLLARVFTGFLITLLGWNLYLNLQTDHSTIVNYSYAVGYSLFYLVTAIAGFAHLSKVGLGSASAKALLFMSLGATVFTCGFWLYTYFIISTGNDVPYPSPADYFFLMFAPLVAVGFSFLLGIFRPVLTRRLVIESFLMLLVGVGAMFYFFIQPQFGGDVTHLERVFNVLYPLDDTLLLALILIAIRVSGGKIHGYFLRFIITFGFMIVGDLLYSYRTSHEIQWNGDIVDLIFTITAYSFAMAVLKMRESVVDPVATFNPQVATQAIDSQG